MSVYSPYLDLIFEYEQILLGDRKSFQILPSLDEKGPGRENKEKLKEKSAFEIEHVYKCAGILYRYVIEELLGWTPQEAIKYFDKNMVHRFKLDKIRHGIAKSDPRMKDCRFFLSYAYKDVKYNPDAQVLEEYKMRTNMGEYKNIKNTKSKHLPKNYFKDMEGARRANLLLRFIVNVYLKGKTKTELYDFFADYPTANNWLRDKRLFIAMTMVYGNPFDYFHASLEDKEKDYLLYYSGIANRLLNGEEEKNPPQNK